MQIVPWMETDSTSQMTNLVWWWSILSIFTSFNISNETLFWWCQTITVTPIILITHWWLLFPNKYYSLGNDTYTPGLNQKRIRCVNVHFYYYVSEEGFLYICSTILTVMFLFLNSFFIIIIIISKTKETNTMGGKGSENLSFLEMVDNNMSP